ncbi:hypothetical protein STEG23_037540, partial [Scotinomys teguina]
EWPCSQEMRAKVFQVAVIEFCAERTLQWYTGKLVERQGINVYFLKKIKEDKEKNERKEERSPSKQFSFVFNGMEIYPILNLKTKSQTIIASNCQASQGGFYDHYLQVSIPSRNRERSNGPFILRFQELRWEDPELLGDNGSLPALLPGCSMATSPSPSSQESSNGGLLWDIRTQFEGQFLDGHLATDRTILSAFTCWTLCLPPDSETHETAPDGGDWLGRWNLRRIVMYFAVSSPQERCGKLLRGSVDENKSGFSATKDGPDGKHVMSNPALCDVLTHELGLPKCLVIPRSLQ